MTEPQPPEYFSPHEQPHPPAWEASGAVPVPIDQPVLTIGDIAVTRTEVIVPHGRFPLRGTAWTVQDSTHEESVIPTYAIVLMILFLLFCLLGLLFLLIHEKRYSGFVSVAVTGPGLYHSVQLPAGPNTAAWATHQVNHARAMAAMA